MNKLNYQLFIWWIRWIWAMFIEWTRFFFFPVTDTRSRSDISSLRTKTLDSSPSTHHREAKAMLEKAEERNPHKGGAKKRKHPGGDDDGKGEERKRKGGEEGERSKGDGGRKRLDALSVGYFRRVGERLAEGFEDKEERGENKCSDDVSNWKVGKVQKKNTWHYSSTPPYQTKNKCSLLLRPFLDMNFKKCPEY